MWKKRYSSGEIHGFWRMFGAIMKKEDITNLIYTWYKL